MNKNDKILLDWCLAQLDECCSDYEWRTTGRRVRNRIQEYLNESKDKEQD